MNIGKLTSAFALTLAVSTLPAMAINTRGTTWNQNRNQSSTWDQNGDGVISRGEWRADAATFDRLDINRDGVLTQAEVRYGKGDKSRFKGMDRDGNGVITRDEWRGNDKSFEKQDRNRDGVISAADHAAKRNGKMKHQKRRDDRDDD